MIEGKHRRGALKGRSVRGRDNVYFPEREEMPYDRFLRELRK